MNAKTYLERVAHALRVARLEAILVGNAAAAIQGAPVTTLDFDFVIRDTPRSKKKIEAFARALSASAIVPYEAVSRMVRVSTAEIQVDLLPQLYGVRASFESLRSRSLRVRVGGEALRVASLEDVIRIKRAASRKKDLAALPVLEETLPNGGANRADSRRKAGRKSSQRLAFERAARRMELGLIRERLARPPEERMDFLRVRLPGGGSAL